MKPAALVALASLALGAWFVLADAVPTAEASPASPAEPDALDFSAGLGSMLASLLSPSAEARADDAQAYAIADAMTWAPPASAEPYLADIVAAEARHGIPTYLLARVLYQESHFRPEIIDGRVSSPAGALGIAQFMPATARDVGIDPLDPSQAIDGAGSYLASLYRQTGNWADALAAYNWGIGNVKRKGRAAAPAETRNYVAEILGDVPV